MHGTDLDLAAIAERIGPTLAEGAERRDAADAFVDGNYDLLKEHRLFSAQVPAELGGGGVSHSAMCGFLRAIARHCPSTALALSMHQHLVAAAAHNHRQGKPGRKLLERVAAGETVLVSTGANDWLESNGAVERAEGGFAVSARKAFCSGAPRGGVLVTSAPYEDPREGWQVLHFPVPLAAPGVTVAEDWRTLGMRATGSHSVVLERVFVPDDAVALRRPRGRFHPAWNAILAAALPLIMSVYLGAAEEAAAIARREAQAPMRRADPTLPYLLGELGNRLTTAQLAVDDMVRLAADLAAPPDLDLTCALLARKTIAAEAVLATAEKALEATGGAGFFRRLGLERLLRDLHGAQFHPLPAKRQQRFTGRVALGLDPVADAAA